jgi:hypothetical protein
LIHWESTFPTVGTAYRQRAQQSNPGPVTRSQTGTPVQPGTPIQLGTPTSAFSPAHTALDLAGSRSGSLTPSEESSKSDGSHKSGKKSKPPTRPASPANSDMSSKGPAIATPTPFNGERSKTKRFIYQCNLYINGREKEFDKNEDTKIAFTLSYMKNGLAASWAQRYQDQLAY